jgi:NADH-quinone oxidoreductase subunit F
VDLVLPDALASDDERAAVDAVLGAASSGWSGGERTEADGRVARGGHEARGQRHLLLPVLHALQSSAGWISPGGLRYACERLTVPPAEAYGVATFYAMFSVEPRPTTVLHLCDDIACKVADAEELIDEVVRQVGSE